jgi:hypothetical protein
MDVTLELCHKSSLDCFTRVEDLEVGWYATPPRTLPPFRSIIAKPLSGVFPSPLMAPSQVLMSLPKSLMLEIQFFFGF